MTADVLLEVDDLHVAYGGVTAVRGVDLAVAPGEAVAILGANGAGKTSVLRAVSGLAPVRAGAVRFDGHDITGGDVATIARGGIAHVPADRGIFATLTVMDNLRTARYGVGLHRDADGQRALDEALELFPVLEERADQPAGTLSGGQQQMLTLARALVQRPRLLLIDEMSMGLAPSIVDELFATVTRLTARGLAVVLVEQFVGQVLRTVDRAVVMAHGAVVATGDAASLAADAVAAAYLGGTGDTRRRRVPTRTRPAAAWVRVPVDAVELRRLRREAAERGVDLTTLGREALTAHLASGAPPADREPPPEPIQEPR